MNVNSVSSVNFSSIQPKYNQKINNNVSFNGLGDIFQRHTTKAVSSLASQEKMSTFMAKGVQFLEQTKKMLTQESENISQEAPLFAELAEKLTGAIDASIQSIQEGNMQKLESTIPDLKSVLTIERKMLLEERTRNGSSKTLDILEGVLNVGDGVLKKPDMSQREAVKSVKKLTSLLKAAKNNPEIMSAIDEVKKY